MIQSSTHFPPQLPILVSNSRPPPLYRPYQRWLQSPDEFNINAMDVSPTADVDANDYDTDANRELENMPFGVQNARSVLPARPTRNRPSSSPSSSSSAAGVQFLTTPPSSRITFQSLCPTRRETVFLNLDQSDFEYRPNHYDEVYCVHPYSNHRTYVPLSNKVEQGVRIGQLLACFLFLLHTIFDHSCTTINNKIRG